MAHRDGGYAPPKKKKRKIPPTPSAAHKDAVTWAAEQSLKPHEVPPPHAKPKPPRSVVLKPGTTQLPLGRPDRAPLPPTARSMDSQRDKRYKAALAAPLGERVKVGKKTYRAREYLAKTMTPERRAQYHSNLLPPPPPPTYAQRFRAKHPQESQRAYDQRRLAAEYAKQQRSPGVSIGQRLGEVADPFVKLARPLYTTPPQHGQKQGPLFGLVPTRRQLLEANKSLMGNAATNLITRGETSHLGAAALEFAALLPPGRALKIAHGLVDVGAVARAGLGREAALAAYQARTGAPLAGTDLIRAAKQSAALRGIAERKQVHTLVDSYAAGNRGAAKALKDEIDADVHRQVQHLPKGAPQKAAAAEIYKQIGDVSRPTGLTRKTVDKLNAPEGVARSAMSADDAGRVKMVASGGKPGAIILTREGAQEAQKAGLLVEHDPIPSKYGGDYWHVAKDDRAMGLMQAANKLFRAGKNMDGDVVFGHAMGYADEDISHYVAQKYGLELPPQPRILTKQEALDQGPSAEFLYHGTTREQAMQIVEEGQMRVGQRAPVGVWFAEDPQAAAFFGDTVVQMPRSLIDSPRLPFGNYAYESDLAFREPRPVFKGIRNVRNARIEAERNPHYAGVPEGGVTPLDESAIEGHIRQSIVDAKRMTSVRKSPKKLEATFRNAYRLAIKGAEFRKWYETSAAAILEHVRGNRAEADKLAQLFGIYSANRDVPANSIFALRAYDEAKAGRAISQGSKAQRRSAEKVMAGENWGGRKTNSFYSNMYKHIDRARYDADPDFGGREVTVDIWMMRMFGFKAKSPSDAQYTWVENQIREIARQLGWEPEEVQAAAWVALKSESEKTSMETAAYDFAHGIDTHRGQIVFKTMNPELERALPKEFHAQHRADVLDALAPIRDILDVPGAGGRIDPNGAAHYIPLLRSKGNTGDYVISAAERQMAREASAAYGHVLDLPSVAYGRVFQSKSLGHANAVRLELADGLSADLAEKIAKQVGRGTEVVHSPEGAWLINRTRTENKAWLKRIEDDLKAVKAGLERNASAVTFDGGIVRRSEYANTLARLQRRQPGAGEALDRVAGDVRAVNERHLDAAGERAGAAAHPEPIAAARFDRAIARSREGPYGAFLSDTPAEQLLADGYRLFVRGPHDEVHWAISAEGDFGYFASGISGFGRHALDDAINNGAITLDAYDGFLPRYYEKSGFREVARNPWNDEFAPPNWDYDKYGRPDVVHMAYMPDQETRKTAFVTDSWDEAKKAAQGVADTRRGPKTEFQASGLEPEPSPQEIAWQQAHPYRTPPAELRAKRYEPGLPPLSPEQAAARVAKIDAMYDSMLDKMVKGIDPGKTGKAITAQRNARAKKIAKRGLPKQETVTQEARRLAEKQLLKVLETNATPEIQGMNRLLDEAARLRRQVIPQMPGEAAPAAVGISPEAEAWRQAHPYREPPSPSRPAVEPPAVPEVAAHIAEPMPPASATQTATATPAEAFHRAAAKTSALRARWRELDLKRVRTPLEQDEYTRLGRQLRAQRQGPAAPPQFVPRAKERTAEEIAAGLADMHGAKSLLGKQDVVQKQEWGRRFGAAEKAAEEAGGGLAGHIAARQEMKGELPRLRFNNPASEDEIDRLVHFVEDNGLLAGDPQERLKIGRLVDAYRRMALGRLPQKNQIALIEEIFGAKEVARIEKDIEDWRRWKEMAIDVLSLPRSLRSSVDFSAPFRQGLFMMYAEPELWAKSWPKGGKAMWSKANHERLMTEILSRPNAKLYRKSGLAIVDDGGLVAPEEAYMSNMADKIPFVNHSQRGYVMFLNRLRADTFDKLYELGIAEHPEWLQQGGADSHAKFVKSLAQTVNILTGRGRFPGHEMAVKTFSAFFFSPRLIASRAEYILAAFNPAVWAPGARVGKYGFAPEKKLARKMVRRSLYRQVIGATTILTLASFLPDITVSTDPKSADFLKIKRGDFRLDILGGTQQYLVLASRLYSGEKTDSSTGETKPIEGYGHTRFVGSLTDFFKNKAAPVPAYFIAWDSGKTFGGGDFDPLHEAWVSLTPLGVESAVKTGKQYGWQTGVADYAGSMFGFGTNVYPAGTPKRSWGRLLPQGDGGGGVPDQFGGGGVPNYFG